MSIEHARRGELFQLSVMARFSRHSAQRTVRDGFSEGKGVDFNISCNQFRPVALFSSLCRMALQGAFHNQYPQQEPDLTGRASKYAEDARRSSLLAVHLLSHCPLTTKPVHFRLYPALHLISLTQLIRLAHQARRELERGTWVLPRHLGEGEKFLDTNRELGSALLAETCVT